jgi:predicted nucleotidyltransferase
MKSDIDQIKNLVNKHLELLKDRYNVKELGVFGSVARGEDTESSDIDVLVEFSQPIGMFKFIELENYLGEILGKKVDLVTKKALKSTIKNDILKEVVYV